MKKGLHDFLPESNKSAHSLCFINHDILAQLLVSGEEQKSFWYHMEFNSFQEQSDFSNTSDIFIWLEKYQKTEERKQILKTVAFPALLSDFLHFIYEALDTSRKAKLTVAYSLLRKPLQEILYIFELFLVDIDKFSKQIMTEPQKLYSQSCGGMDVHKKRIDKVLNILGKQDYFDSEYIAQLRYDKSSTDGFDGFCNKAIHLFTSHQSIKTEPININFIFSGLDAKFTQWDYLYSRLPYLLVYARMVIEKVSSTICSTSLEYLNDVERRSSAAVLIWEKDIKDNYMNKQLKTFIASTKESLNKHCLENRYNIPTLKDLINMKDTGSFPKEKYFNIKARNNRFQKIRKQNMKDLR